MPDLKTFLDENSEAFVESLKELLRIPSVSTDSRHKDDVKAASEWVASRFRELNFETKVIPTEGHPIVYAESPPVPGKPVALVYGHYDVQPPDPLNLWTTPPFEPTLRDGNIVARGATDDKGQMLTHVLGALAWMKTAGELPIQVKFLIEGEEEIGSANLGPFIEQNKKLLANDVVVISDSSQFAPGQPAITYGLKGIAYFELKLTGPNRDLHSGSFGGSVRNPANALCSMLNTLIDEHGWIHIPGFYDDVRPMTGDERGNFAELPFDEEKFKEQLGIDAVHGEEGYTTLERRWARPTLDINGLTSGYQGEGAKTVLPGEASAKFSCRLVPDQCPQKIGKALREHLEKICPSGIKMELIEYHGAPGFVVATDSPYIQAASAAIEQGFGNAPVLIREGGSIPIVAQFADQLKSDVLLLGWGLDDDNTHSPNEKFNLADFQRGIAASAQLWAEIAKIEK
ncbi:dipeptidase [Bremerella sp. T1]|uniref:dipeptidase n=1 Tax=Bremerella sp. TYQ1 TaxID=3119568 RepID=UPI001CCD05A4|nr:dipeptidase [Bremerella volcania]UBM35914.1 dipeptidase [Bremerella volcania]